MAIIEILKDSELFHGLEMEQLQKIAPWCYGDNYKQGAEIIKEGDEAKELFLVTEGMVALDMALQPLLQRRVIPMTIEVVKKGEIFGWSALVEPYKYTATAKCVGHSTVLAVNAEQLRRVMSEDAKIGFAVMSRLTQVVENRLAQTRSRLISGLGLIMLERGLHNSV